MKNGHTTRQKTPAGRYALLDELRGLDLVSMMLYHACWDMMFLFGIWMDWYAGMPGRLWQQTICWVFILLSGFCAPFGRHMLRRGVTVFAAGALVTAVTLVFMPGNRVIFGVLTFLGTAMLLTGVLEPLLKKIPPAAGLAVSAVLFALTYHLDERWLGFGGLRLALPDAWYANYFTAFFGFLPFDFYSTDYILPCCRGCFCSGQGTFCTAWWAGRGWNRCAVRSARRWAGWAGTRFCCICCTSR